MYVAHWISGPYLSRGLPVSQCYCWSSWPPAAYCHTEARDNTAGIPPALRLHSPPSGAAGVQIKLKVKFPLLTLCFLLKTWCLRRGRRGQTGRERVSAARCLCGSQSMKQMAEILISRLVSH